MRSVILSANV